ncbi:undecaprenyl diphosphate synthase [Weissella beninensis]|uniref:Isoprenyl transferase n=1 Tax=Periweissella beninensis TaxID=504936 RepID=A0ABT0VI46_9LACO|nr:undecaprenyl diphosphate synthase [Periweissella beninensis]MCM2437504.1 isoprenyl transferase [Periweissella beninensis]
MFGFKGKKQPTIDSNETLDLQRIPKHVAIIMDGNGRWAQQRHLPRIAGHKEGMNTVKKITMVANDLGIQVLTLYAFSTENWKRPDQEVNYLMGLPVTFFDTFVPELIANNIQVQVIGYTDQLPAKTQKAVNNAIEQTKNNTGMVLNFALNYGSRAEIVSAVQAISQEVVTNNLTIEAIDETLISEHLMTKQLNELADPDVIIRTSGEQRISNFLLWQIAYSEFVFIDEHWPAVDATIFKHALFLYQKRDRRFGGLNK